MSTEPQPHRFRAVIEQAADSGGAFVTIPFDVERVFGRKRVPVQATIDGVPYRGSLVRMGGPCHMLLILKEIRERLGKQAGDEVDIVLVEDTAPRTVEVPADLRDALAAAPAASAFYQTLAYTHQREYVQWIESAKRPQTRAERVARAVALLGEGKKAR